MMQFAGISSDNSAALIFISLKLPLEARQLQAQGLKQNVVTSVPAH